MRLGLRLCLCLGLRLGLYLGLRLRLRALLRLREHPEKTFTAQHAVLLQEAADGFLAENAPIAHLRKLRDDRDADGDTLAIAELATGPANGSLTVDADGSFVYTPNPGFVGTDSFTYRARDAAATSGVATVTLTVTGGP